MDDQEIIREALFPRSALAWLGRLAIATRREWSEFERCVVLIEYEIDTAEETAVSDAPSREHFSLPMLDILLADGATPHRRTECSTAFIALIRL